MQRAARLLQDLHLKHWELHTTEYTSGPAPAFYSHSSTPLEKNRCRHLCQITDNTDVTTQSLPNTDFLYKHQHVYHLEQRDIYSDKTASCSFCLLSTRHLLGSVKQ